MSKVGGGEEESRVDIWGNIILVDGGKIDLGEDGTGLGG